MLALWEKSVHAWGFIDWAKFIVVVAVIVGIVYVVLRECGITIPGWVWHIVGLVALALVALLAIGFIASL